MRGAFNKTLTARHGSRSVTGPPGVVYASDIPCRVVDQDQIFQGQFDLSLCTRWVTMDELLLVGPNALSPYLGAVFYDQLSADEVAFDDAPTVWYSVVRRELVDPFARPSYWRFLLLPLSSVETPPWLPPSIPPAAPPGGGLTCDTAGQPAFDEVVSGDTTTTTSAWFRFVAPAAGDYRIVDDGSDVDSVCIIYSGLCDALVYVTGIVLYAVGCYTVTLAAGEVLTLNVITSGVGSVPYGLHVSIGACP